MEGNGRTESIESDETKLSEEVDGQVTREWRSCKSDQGGSCVVGIPRANPRMRPRWIGKPTVEMKRLLWGLISCEHV
ncbi:unnamed protein product [Prunus armeniaca]